MKELLLRDTFLDVFWIRTCDPLTVEWGVIEICATKISRMIVNQYLARKVITRGQEQSHNEMRSVSWTEFYAQMSTTVKL